MPHAELTAEKIDAIALHELHDLYEEFGESLSSVKGHNVEGHKVAAPPELELLFAGLEYAATCALDGTDPEEGLRALHELDADDLDAIADGTVEKAWKEGEHPRDDHGAFTSSKDIRDATRDPKKAAELRAKVNAPEERTKLESLLREGKQPLGGVARSAKENFTADAPQFHDHEGHEHIGIVRGDMIAAMKRAAEHKDTDRAEAEAATAGKKARRVAKIHWHEAKKKALAQFEADAPEQFGAEEKRVLTDAFDAAERATGEAYLKLANAASYVAYRAANGEPEVLTDPETSARQEFEQAYANAKEVYTKQTEAVWEVVKQLRDKVVGAEKGYKLGRYFKAYDESKHPRGKDGRYIGKDAIQEAKTDPAKAKELRAKVKPEDAGKLEDALSGKADLGLTKRGEAKETTRKKRDRVKANRDEAIAIRGRLFKQYQQGEALDADDMRALIPHLSTMTHDELSDVHTFLHGAGAKFGGARRLDERRAKLVAWARQKALESRMEEQGFSDEEKEAAMKLVVAGENHEQEKQRQEAQDPGNVSGTAREDAGANGRMGTEERPQKAPAPEAPQVSHATALDESRASGQPDPATREDFIAREIDWLRREYPDNEEDDYRSIANDKLKDAERDGTWRMAPERGKYSVGDTVRVGDTVGSFRGVHDVNGVKHGVIAYPGGQSSVPLDQIQGGDTAAAPAKESETPPPKADDAKSLAAELKDWQSKNSLVYAAYNAADAKGKKRLDAKIAKLDAEVNDLKQRHDAAHEALAQANGHRYGVYHVESPGVEPKLIHTANTLAEAVQRSAGHAAKVNRGLPSSQGKDIANEHGEAAGAPEYQLDNGGRVYVGKTPNRGSTPTSQNNPSTGIDTSTVVDNNTPIPPAGGGAQNGSMKVEPKKVKSKKLPKYYPQGGFEVTVDGEAYSFPGEKDAKIAEAKAIEKWKEKRGTPSRATIAAAAAAVEHQRKVREWSPGTDVWAEFKQAHEAVKSLPPNERSQANHPANIALNEAFHRALAVAVETPDQAGFEHFPRASISRLEDAHDASTSPVLDAAIRRGAERIGLNIKRKSDGYDDGPRAGWQERTAERASRDAAAAARAAEVDKRHDA
jgi:hypothetical protein